MDNSIVKKQKTDPSGEKKNAKGRKSKLQDFNKCINSMKYK